MESPLLDPTKPAAVLARPASHAAAIIHTGVSPIFVVGSGVVEVLILSLLKLPPTPATQWPVVGCPSPQKTSDASVAVSSSYIAVESVKHTY